MTANIPNYSEADTRAKLIDPALHKRGWTEDYIRREENAGGLYKVRGRWRRDQKFADYLLRIPIGGDPEPIAIAVIEAKRSGKPVQEGFAQAKEYARAERLNVPFTFTSNGHRFIEYDKCKDVISKPTAMSQFPAPTDLRARYEQHLGINLEDEAAKPLRTPYTGGDSVRRYYQDAAIRAILEAIAQGRNRMLVAMATGSGKTRVVVHLLKRIADAGHLHRVLFVCDRTELRDQATAAFQNVFGNDAQPVDTSNPRKNARILIATYQTLDVDTEEGEATFLTESYLKNYFSHVIIDECHRSAWGKWSVVLTRNPDAIQIGLTATPRQLNVKANTPEAQADARITADNIAYFGEPAYEYTMSQGIADGYLAACEIQKGDVDIDHTGITIEDIIARNPIDAITGEPVTIDQLRQLYEKTSYEDRILLPDRVMAMTESLFAHLLKTGGPEQKTIIFCVSDNHADRVAIAMHNLYTAWCKKSDRQPKDNYAFKCTAKSSGNDMLPDLRASANSYFVATTVDLLTTGVDVPCVRNIVFFRYLRSPIAFHQMVGRGTRLYPQDDKLHFRVYDYTNATDLFGEDFITAPTKARVRDDKPLREGDEDDEYRTEPIIEVCGFDVIARDAGKLIVADVDGKAVPITVEEYKQQIAARLVEKAPHLPDFRRTWVSPDDRKALLLHLPYRGQSALLIRQLEAMDEYDLFDVLAQLGYGMAPRTRKERAAAFEFKHTTWLNSMPARAADTIRALTAQFARGGTEELETPEIFRVPAVMQAGGIPALKQLGNPADVLRDTKVRMFAA